MQKTARSAAPGVELDTARLVAGQSLEGQSAEGQSAQSPEGQSVEGRGGLPQLYFVRHGQTDWSLTGQHTGRTDIALTLQGEDQARALGPSLHDVRFTRVLTSPRQRARRTCELAGVVPAAKVEPDLAEWDYGEYEGRTTADISRARPGWNVFRDGCPGGESPANIAERADRLIARLAALTGNVALFSHGHFGAALAVRWIGLPVIEGQHFAIGTASLGILGHQRSHPELRAIVLWNAASPARPA